MLAKKDFKKCELQIRPKSEIIVSTLLLYYIELVHLNSALIEGCTS
jgi:hypothetical protein